MKILFLHGWHSEELAKDSGATLIEVGTDHRLDDPEPLEKMLRACEVPG
jgi:hypothetical protein